MSSATESNALQRNVQSDRLFYVETDQTSHEQISRIAADQDGVQKTSRVLNQADLKRTQFFGIYGDRFALQIHLESIFPGSYDQINSCFTDEEAMPSIWTIHNDHKIVLTLILPDEETLLTSDVAWSYTIVMQRLLQDICHNIIISPSEDFFVNFTIEHSFHRKPHTQRKYRQVETSPADIQAAQKVRLEHGESLKLLMSHRSHRVLPSDVSLHMFSIARNTTENDRDAAKKFQELKKSLNNIDLDSLKISHVIELCRKHGIPISRNQQTEISEILARQLKFYHDGKSIAENHSRTIINEMIGRYKIFGFGPEEIEISKEVRDSLRQSTTDWLVNPRMTDVTPQQIADSFVESIDRNRTNKTHGRSISSEQRQSIIEKLEKHDQKHQMEISRAGLIERICLSLQSDNQFDVDFALQQWSFTASNTQQIIPDISMNASKSNRFSLSALAEYLQIVDLSENDRRIFADRLKFIACFKTYDGAANILVLRRPKIMTKTISSNFGHILFYLNNGNLRKIVDYFLDNISITFACSSTKQTMVLYNITTGGVTKCRISTFGQCERSDILYMQDKAHKPSDVKSIALNVAQDLLILIDGKSNVYSMDLSVEKFVSPKLLCKGKDGTTYESNFRAGNDEVYDDVQTIGERSPIFFFRSYSFVDIMDQNFCQLQSIQLRQHSLPYRMKIFVDSLTTYCVLFSNEQYESYAVQNLVSETRTECQRSTADLDQSVQQKYIGNRLLDVIQCGEIQFGPPSDLQKTKYHFLLPGHRTDYHDRIVQYYHALSLVPALKAMDSFPQLLIPSQDAKPISQKIRSRVPIQLCTIEMGTLIPFSFSYLDPLLNEINHSLPIIGIIGRQSTGKSYLMNRVFGTRFGVAAGRCTDGIWMSYAVVDDQEFVILDCEGLFSDQRTEEEEMKLLAFLSAMCDVTILSQDLGFSRYQDRLFDLLLRAKEKIDTSEKLFKGRLLVALRDVGGASAEEARKAAADKFMDLQRRGRSSFLEHLFCNSFTIQPLHHFEIMTFNSEIVKLREFFKNLAKSERWKDGKELVDRMKILLTQLHLDAFGDSNKTHVQLKIDRLKEEKKKIWLDYDLKNVTPQVIEKEFQGKSYRLEINHQHLKFDEVSMNKSYQQLVQYLIEAMSFNSKTKEDDNHRLRFLDSLIPDVIDYRRKQTKDILTERFTKEFSNEKNKSTIQEKLSNLLKDMDKCTNKFQLRMCMKKCLKCDLKCVERAEHTQETITLLQEKEKQLAALNQQLSSDPFENQIQSLTNRLVNARQKETHVLTEKNKLEDERRCMIEKEEVENRMKENQSKIDDMQGEINKLQTGIEVMEKKLKDFIPSANRIEEIDGNIGHELRSLFDSQLYRFGEQEGLMKKFYDEDAAITLAAISFENDDDLHRREVNQLISLMKEKVNKLSEICSDVRLKVQAIQENLVTEENQSNEILNDIKKLEAQSKQLATENKERQKKIDEAKKYMTDLEEKKVSLLAEKDPLEKKIEKEDVAGLSDQIKIDRYIKQLQSSLSDDGNHTAELEQAQILLEELKIIEKSISDIEVSLKKLQKQKSVKEKNIQEYKEEDIDAEEEEKSLVVINQKIQETEGQLTDEKSKKSSMADENELLKKILTEPMSIVEERTRLEELCRRIDELDQEIMDKTKEVSLHTDECEQNDATVRALSHRVQEKRDEKTKREEKVIDQTKKCQCGNDLHRSLLELEKKMINSSKRLEELDQVRQLLNDHRSSSETLRVKSAEMSVFRTNCSKLSEESAEKACITQTCKHSCSKDYNDRLEQLNKDYEDTHQEVKQLEEQLNTINQVYQLSQEIERLKNEDQVNCDCRSDHKCSSQCQICTTKCESDLKPCNFAAGHLGEHKCDAGHVCKELCQICQLRGDKPKQCHLSYEHKEPSYHRCELDHLCPKTCETCSNPCEIPFDFKSHSQHRCSSEDCWKPCMFSCGKKCMAKDHNHDAATEMVEFVDGDGRKVKMKKHLCDQKHRCLGVCDTPGICKLEFTYQQKSWRTESDENSNYPYFEMKASRNKCAIEIDAGLCSHDAANKQHKCDAQEHTCEHRCPDCQGFCRRPHGHAGHHMTEHRNKEQHIFISTNPSEMIEIGSGDSNESIIRKYKVGESSKPENCAASCKRRGHGHFHLIECPGDDDCYEKKFGLKAKHSNDVYYYGPDQAILKKYDQILCSAYWSLMQWHSPVTDNDTRKLIDSCNFFCDKHVDKNNGQIKKDSSNGFCNLNAWHTDHHTFECKSKHQNMAKYQGLDVCFVIDTTASMDRYFDMVKSTIKRIIQENEPRLKKIKTSGTLQFAIVDYRDHPTEADYVCRQLNFTNHKKAIEYVEKLTAESGGDPPEAVLDGLDAACELKWRDTADHLLFHVLNAPPHGRIYNTSPDDRWPDGCPCGKTAEAVLTKMNKKEIGYNVLLFTYHSALNMMIQEFKKFIAVKTLSFTEGVSFQNIIAQRIEWQLNDTEMTIERFQ